MTSAACPDPRQLQQLLLGRSSEAAAERLETHLEHCDRCNRLLPTLPANDTLVEAMHARATFVLQPSDQARIQGLLPQLRRLRTTFLSTHGSSARESSPGEAGFRSGNLESFDFLGPPQTPGEIGRLGPYRVLKILGHGGMGVVFLAEDPQLQRTVALKVMRPDVAKNASARERFLREARATAQIENDHIVTIYQVGEDHGVPFLAMQLLKGMSLEDFLQKQQGSKFGASLTVEQILKLGREIAKGLAAAHEKGLIHRDIKPANVWLDATVGGRVKILDFGLARVADAAAPLTKLGTVVGTAAYMSPEQARSDPIDSRADLFSLGCVLYRLCTGRLPWKGGDVLETLVAVTTEEPTPVQKLTPDLPPKLAQLVMKLLAKDPKDRPESARIVVEAIQALEREQPATQVKAAVPVAALLPAAPARPLPEAPITAVPARVRPAPPAPLARVRRRPLHRAPARRGPLWLLGVLLGTAALVVAAAVIYLVSRNGSPVRPPRKAEEAGITRRKDSPELGPKEPANGRASEPRKLVVNSIGMKLVYISPGKFLMGSSAEDLARITKEPFPGYTYGPTDNADKLESPQHEVRITRGFYLGVYEVTQGQYEKVMGTNPSVNKDSPDHPVGRVIWEEAMAFCRKLSALPEEKQAGRVYRLPTEAEWEYACRAGTTTLFHYGNALSFRQANIDPEHPFGTPEKGPHLGKSIKVGSYEPNAWGLYDMHGNVWEWCLDNHRTYTADAVEDPRGPEIAGGGDVLRGGGFARGACRSAYRKVRGPLYRIPDGGFRVVCVQ